MPGTSGSPDLESSGSRQPNVKLRHARRLKSRPQARTITGAGESGVAAIYRDRNGDDDIWVQ